MTAFTKFIIGSVISFFGTLTPTDLADTIDKGITEQVQELRSEELYLFPRTKESENLLGFTCFRYNFREKY